MIINQSITVLHVIVINQWLSCYAINLQSLCCSVCDEVCLLTGAVVVSEGAYSSRYSRSYTYDTSLEYVFLNSKDNITNIVLSNHQTL